jgi:hypothetical protein
MASNDYTVTWEIQLSADSPRAAAELALEIQRDVYSDAVVFSVTGDDGNQTTVDLMEAENENDTGRV